MRSAYLVGTALLSLVLALPVQAQKDKKSRSKNKPAEALKAEKVLRPGAVVGKLASLEGNVLTLRAEYQTYELKPGGRRTIDNANRQNQNLLRQLQRLDQLQIQAMTARNQRQYSNVMRQIQNLVSQIQRQISKPQQSPYRLVKKSVEIEIEMATDVKIRTRFLPFAYDDMGNSKTYTKAEKKELKGPNPKEPGYKSSLDALKVGNAIKVTLARIKIKDPDATDDEKVPDAKGKATKDKTTKKKPLTRLLATKILILNEDEQPESKNKKKGRKKN